MRKVCRLDGKVLGQRLKGKCVEYFQGHTSIYSSPPGFVPKGSCLSSLLVLEKEDEEKEDEGEQVVEEQVEEEWVTGLVDSKKDVDVIYLDFAKAFDYRDHRLAGVWSPLPTHLLDQT